MAVAELAASLFGEGSASKTMPGPFNGQFTCCSLPACTAFVLPSELCNSYHRFLEPIIGLQAVEVECPLIGLAVVSLFAFMNPAEPALPSLSLPSRVGIALVAFVVNVLAVGWLLLEGTGFEIHDTPDLMAYHRLAVGSKMLLGGLLLANLGLFVYVCYTHKTQAARGCIVSHALALT